ncbi:MAG: ATP-binding protein [Gammaproteobacteria bacterium]
MLPKSLFGRMILIQVLGVVVAGGVGAAIHSWEVDRIFAQSDAAQAAQRIADIVGLLDRLEPAERGKVVAILNTRRWFASLDPAAALRAGAGAQRHPGLVRFEEPVRRALGSRALKVVLADQGATGASYLVQARLTDGHWVTLGYRRSLTSSAARLFWTWPTLAVAIVIAAWVAVRWVTRPLSILAQAAEDLGRDINCPPLKESGPSEVRHVASVFNHMQSQLARLLQDRVRIFSAMSHDLKTPVTRLRLRAEMLEDAELKAKFAADLELMETMVNATLDFARGMSDREVFQPVDIMALIESIQADAEEMGRSVAVGGHAAGPYSGKALALKRCIGNLVDNAIKYGQRAKVMVDDDGRRLQIRVLDTGPGIPKPELERVFEPFYRLETSRSRESGGTGLGLAIARNIAHLHGGELALNNADGGGLEALLTLPRGLSPSGLAHHKNQ